MLQYVAVCCSMLQCRPVCSSLFGVMQCVTVCCSVLQFVAVCWSGLQWVVACCSVLQRVALRCSAFQSVCDSLCLASCSGYSSRTWFRRSHMVVKTLLYCTRKCGCEGGVVSASCHLQPPRNGSTGQVSLLEHEAFSRTVLGTPRTCTRCSQDEPRECFMFQEGSLTTWTVARWLQMAACWHDTTFAATFPGTIQ